MHGIRYCVIISMLMFLKEFECSKNRHMESFIINGEFSKIRDYPHCVSLFIDCVRKSRCGSSVINQKILLTAAHCLSDCQLHGRIDAFAGHENYKKFTVKRRARDFLIHEKYSSVVNDIGLIVLEKDLPLGERTKRAILTKQNSYGLTAVVAGWGLINENPRERTIFLKRAAQKVLSMRTCSKLKTLHPGILCAVNTKSSHSRPSKGDSGSALITTRHRQIGVVSFGYLNYPDLVFYANTSYYYDWIRSRSQRLYCGK